MKRTKLQILASVFVMLFAEISSAQVTDNFSDGDFTNNPVWSGDTASWEVLGGQLHSKNIVANDTFYLSTPSAAAGPAQWEFWINMQANTSSLNYVKVFLVSDIADLNGNNSGYYVMLGGTPDEISLYQKAGTVSTKIIDGLDGVLNSSNSIFKIKITHDASDLWKLERDSTGTGNFFVTEGTVTDATFSASSYFGVLVKQSTSSFFGKHYMDNFYAGPIIVDTILPTMDSLAVISQNQLDVYFSEGVDTAFANAELNYSVDNGIGNPFSAIRDAGISSLVHLYFTTSFPSGIWNTLTATGVKDLSGNTMVPESDNFIFYLTAPAAATDLAINEVLFDPNTGGVEWAEIYNRSNKIIDLQEISICNLDANGNFSNIRQITSQKHLFFPGDYIVLSEDQTAIKAQYTTPNPSGFIDMSSFISLNNDSAYVILLNDSQDVIDKLHYYSDWHLPLLNDAKGISLERINYDTPAQDKNNWHSAAESAGGATPAYKNSQYTDGETGNDVTVAPEVFSPDNDGYNDVLSISYAFDSPGMIGNVKVFDSRGRLEKTLVRNELLATSGTFFWDGINDEKLKARIGIYIIYFEAFDDKGNVKKYKKTCVVGGKF